MEQMISHQLRKNTESTPLRRVKVVKKMKEIDGKFCYLKEDQKPFIDKSYKRKLVLKRKHVSFKSVRAYNVFHRFRQAKFAYGGSILSSIQFLLLTQLP
jgi:hypothetical protein